MKRGNACAPIRFLGPRRDQRQYAARFRISWTPSGGVKTGQSRDNDLLAMSPAEVRLEGLRRLLATEDYTEKFNTSFECCCCPLEVNNNCSHVLLTFSNYLDVLHVYYIPIIIGVGFIGNLLSCLVLLTTHLKLRSSSYYLAALAVADTGYLLCTFIVYCSSKDVFNLYHMQGFCQFFVYLTYVCAFLSVWLIVAFTVERFIAVQYPLRRPYICTVSRAKTIVFSLTGVAIVCYLYIFWIAGIVNDECQLLPDYKNFAKVLNSVDTIITLVVPVVLIVGMNAMIARSLFRFRKKLQFEGVLDELFTSEKTELYSNSQVKISIEQVYTVSMELNKPANSPDSIALVLY